MPFLSALPSVPRPADGAAAATAIIMALKSFSWLAYAQAVSGCGAGDENETMPSAVTITSSSSSVPLDQDEGSAVAAVAATAITAQEKQTESGGDGDGGSIGIALGDDMRAKIELKRLAALALKRKRAEVGEGEGVKEAPVDLAKCQLLKEDGSECCSSVGIDAELLKAFDERVCALCKAAHREDYQLITKTDVASEFLLPADSIGLMKFVERSNPKNSLWVPMKMYLRIHAHRKSIAKWGSQEALLVEKKRRDKAKFQRQMDRSLDVFGGANSLEHYLESSGQAEVLVEVNKVETKKSRAQAQKKKVDALLSVFTGGKK